MFRGKGDDESGRGRVDDGRLEVGEMMKVVGVGKVMEVLEVGRGYDESGWGR